MNPSRLALLLLPAFLLVTGHQRTAIAQPPPHPAPASDVNTDGNTDNADLAEFVNAWNAAVAAGPQQPTGACCVGTACYRTTQARCTQLGGTWQLNVSCTTGPNPCAAPTPTGACCTGTTCTVTTQAACVGTYKGDGTSCTPNPCQPPPPSTGWTDLTTPAGAIVYYVAANGNDSANGTSTNTPFRTVARGMSAVRDGSADQVLLRKGDSFSGVFGLAKSGQSATARIVIGAYGTGARPRIVGGFFRGSSRDSNGNLAIVGLNISPGGGAESAVAWQGGPDRQSGFNLLFEDCMFSGYRENVSLQGTVDAKFFRCLFLDAQSGNANLPPDCGLYVGLAKGLTVEECIFDHNGWNPRSLYHHNVYIQDDVAGPCVFKKNIVLRGGSSGLMLRSGGECVDNVCSQNAMPIVMGGNCCSAEEGSAYWPQGITCNVSGNVVLESDDISGQDLRSCGIFLCDIRTATVDGNIIANKRGSGSGGGIILDPNFGTSVGINACSLTRNLVWSWNPPRQFDQPNGGRRLTYTEGTGAAANAWGTGNYPNPTRSLRSYSSSIGGAGTDAAVWAAVRAQSKDSWDNRWSADALLTYFRAGFGVTR